MRAGDKKTLTRETQAEIDNILESYGYDRQELIKILKEVQEVIGFLPPQVQTYIADRLNLPVSEVAGVVSFYHFFRTEPVGRYQVNVCLGTACYVQGAQSIYESWRRELKMPEGKNTSDDGLFTVSSSRCVGACGLAPVVTINGKVYGNFSAQEVKRLIYRYRRTAAQEDTERKGTADVPFAEHTEQYSGEAF